MTPERRSGSGRGRGPRAAEPPPGLFRDLVLAPDRDRESGARPIVSFSGDEEAEFLREVERRARGRVALRRRGAEHGTWVELAPEGLLPPRGRTKQRRARRIERWIAARPLVLPGVVDPPRPLAREAAELFARLSRPEGLAAWLERRLGEGGGVALVERDAERHDPERDLARVVLEAPVPDAARTRRVWVKAGRLSTHPDDRSLRARVSFGREGEDDASRDLEAHAAVGALARRLLPGASAVAGAEELRALLEELNGGPVLATQHIAYWNAPDGGALFHHDAFAEDADGRGQRGVLYVQLDGRTAWLALSIEDLGLRLREVVAWLAQGELPWVVDDLAEHLPLAELQALVGDWRALQAELAAPGCGRLAPLVNRGPEVTSFLADCGHAAVLEPGDAILLPNHGLERTAMHSVFHAGGLPAYGLSVALFDGPGAPGRAAGDRPDRA